MSTITEIVVALAMSMFATSALAADAREATYGFGTRPSEAELGHFVSPRPDGRGLPHGSGSLREGKPVPQQPCASGPGEEVPAGIGDGLVGGRRSLVNDDPKKAPVKPVEGYSPCAPTL